MLAQQQQAIEERLPDPLDPELAELPFEDKWVFNGRRQSQLLEHSLGQLGVVSSLVMIYTFMDDPVTAQRGRWALPGAVGYGAPGRASQAIRSLSWSSWAMSP